MSQPLIQIIGSLHLDFVTTTTRCPVAGETLRASRFDINAGGKGANQAAACGRAAYIRPDKQDIEVQMIGAVGKDDPYYVSLLQSTLTKSGVSTELVAQIPDSTTGSATIIVEEDSGENRILFVPGAGFVGMSDPTEILKRSARGGKQPSVVVLQGEIPRDTVLAIVEHFNALSGTEVIFNPAPVWPEGVPAKTLADLSTLIVNETECLLLTSSLAKENKDIRTVENESNFNESNLLAISEKLHQSLHIRSVIVTLGGKGVFYSTKGGQSGIIPALKVDKVVDTTGAGDTFVGYYAAELARFINRHPQGDAFDVARACEIATAAAAKCVSRAGAMQSIPFGYE